MTGVDGQAVVMVDDNEGDREIARICFRRSRLTNPWLAFPDGEKFLDYIADVEQRLAPMPALVLLDINMPRLTGFDVLRRLRAREAFQDAPPVFILTSSTNPDDRSEATTLGASGFAPKVPDINEYTRFFDSLEPHCQG